MAEPLIAPALAIQSRVSIPARNLQLSADLTQPAAPAGWLVVARQPRDPLDRWLSDEISREALEAGWATLVLDSATGSIGRAVEHLRSATLWLRSQPEAQGLPVVYLGSGRTAAVALRAAGSGAPVSSVITWNGRPDLAWSHLKAVKAPSLLMVNRQAPRLTRWLNQLARWQIGPGSEFALTTSSSPLNAAALEWLRRPHAPPRRAGGLFPQARPLGRYLATGALLVAALGAPLRGARAAEVHKLNFGDGQVLSVSQVKGDGVGYARTTSPSLRDMRFGDSLTLKAKHVKGDGLQSPTATGSRALIDSQGLKFFVNTHITFSTSSSASGAASQASFTKSLPATTAAGGTTPATLTNALNGYNALCLSLNGTTSKCATGNANFKIYEKNGAAALTCDGVISPTIKRQVVLPTQNINNTLSVSRKVFVPDNDQFIRWLDIVTNTTGTTQTVSLITSNNLKAGSSTNVFGSSTGVTGSITATLNAPYWVGTFQNYSGSTSSEPRLGHVLYGPHAAVGLASINFVNGDRNPWWAYNLTLAAGQTQIVMNFATGQPSKAAVAAKAGELVGLPNNALECMSAAEVLQVVNFNTSHVITPTAGLNGAIIPGTPQTITYGSGITFTIAPNTGYRILDVGVDGSSQGPLNLYAFNDVTTTHTLTATFGVTSHVITPTAGLNGAIIPGTPQTITYGSGITFTIVPNALYRILDVGVDGSSQGPLNLYAFNDVTTTHTITATFGVSPVYLPFIKR